MGVIAGTERQCTEDEHDDEDENDSRISEFGLKGTVEARLRNVCGHEDGLLFE